jgi:hypothetical protein
VRICQVSDGKEVAVLGAPRGGQFKDWLSAVALSNDGRYLAATDIAGLVHVWEINGGYPQSHRGHREDNKKYLYSLCPL